jgi:hypothetical protein
MLVLFHVSGIVLDIDAAVVRQLLISRGRNHHGHRETNK